MAGEGCVYRRCGCTDPGTGRQCGRACPRLAAGGRHGSWYVRLELPAGLDGRRRRIRRGGYPSRKAALEVLARLRAPRTGDTGARMLTVGDWLAHWLVTKTATAPSTVRGYAAHVRLYLTPYLGEVLLAELTSPWATGSSWKSSAAGETSSRSSTCARSTTAKKSASAPTSSSAGSPCSWPASPRTPAARPGPSCAVSSTGSPSAPSPARQEPSASAPRSPGPSTTSSTSSASTRPRGSTSSPRPRAADQRKHPGPRYTPSTREQAHSRTSGPRFADQRATQLRNPGRTYGWFARG